MRLICEEFIDEQFVLWVEYKENSTLHGHGV